MRRIAAAVLLASSSTALLSAAPAHATTYMEDFNAAFPAWQSGWFGTNSNAANCYVALGNSSSYRGNNPDGLWIASTGQGCGGGAVTVTFNAGFAASLTSFALDVAGYSATTLSFYNAAGVLLSATPVTLTQGAYTNPGSYVRYSVSSSTGIGSFSFSGSAAGNTSIDNLVAITGAATAVPEPATWALMLAGFGAVGLAMRRRRTVSVGYAA